MKAQEGKCPSAAPKRPWHKDVALSCQPVSAGFRAVTGVRSLVNDRSLPADLYRSFFDEPFPENLEWRIGKVPETLAKGSGRLAKG